MEGVVVSAKKAGGTVTVSVATDDKGRFSFPASKLEPGQYVLSTRAIGYELEGPSNAEVSAGQTAASRSSSARRRTSRSRCPMPNGSRAFPGPNGENKAILNCVSCHNLDRIVRSQYNAEQFLDVFNRMVGYYPGSTPEHPQRLVGNAQRSLGQGDGVKAIAGYLS